MARCNYKSRQKQHLVPTNDEKSPWNHFVQNADKLALKSYAQGTISQYTEPH